MRGLKIPERLNLRLEMECLPHYIFAVEERRVRILDFCSCVPQEVKPTQHSQRLAMIHLHIR